MGRGVKTPDLNLVRLKAALGACQFFTVTPFFDDKNILEPFSCCKGLSWTTAGQGVLDTADSYWKYLGLSSASYQCIYLIPD